jgi:hypothetical protein
MPPLKAIEQASYGGVDSRSNPINMPQNRFLLLRNWRPRADGHLELREGYTEVDMSLDPGFASGVAVHSISPYLFATPVQGVDATHVPVFTNTDGSPANGLQCILFWRDKVPYLRRLDTGVTVSPPIDGAAIQSSHRWQYALGKSGYLYMHNGTDMKFFDGVEFRDIGLPTLSAAQIAGINVQEGLSAPSSASISTATFTLTASANNWTTNAGYLYYGFFDVSDDVFAPQSTPIANTTYPTTATTNDLVISGLPTSTDAQAIGVLSINSSGGLGAQFLVDNSARTGGAWIPGGVMSQLVGTSPPTTQIDFTGVGGHGLALATHFLIGLELPTGASPPVWKTGGPFWAYTLTDPNLLYFVNLNDIADYAGPITVVILKYYGPPGTTPTSITLAGFPEQWWNQAAQESEDGSTLVPFSDAPNAQLLPASGIGGAQPGYQFYASIYNPLTGHVGNRVPIGQRLDNTGDCAVVITGLPAIGSTMAQKQVLRWGNGTEDYKFKKQLRQKQKQGRVFAMSSVPFDSEWKLLLGRTGDGGEVPYAIIDANGNWVFYDPNTDISPTTGIPTKNINSGNIDGNSELPTLNYIPPPFACFWREGDRQCGAIANYSADGVTPVSLQPFVYRSASEVDDTTGIFVGDPAQAWNPAQIETFPTAQAILGGFGFMQESWVFSTSDMGQLSELSGEVAWNGPYNFGIAGPYAFDGGWQSLPFWVSHDKQLCTILPDANGPMSISTEYEAALLARIGDDVYDAAGNLTEPRLAATEVTYFLDPLRLVEELRIHCVDDTGTPFLIIHDFTLRDDSSPYGQGYEADFNGELGTQFTQQRIRDALGHSRMWAGAQNSAFYQFYSGGDDNGTLFVADAISLRYVSGDRTATKTLEWYGDDTIVWYIYDGMADVDGSSPNTWVKLSDEMRPFPGDARNDHYMADVQRPEMLHCFLWAQLASHVADAVDPANPMALNSPPHMPLETYGRLYFTAPVMGDTRGR